MPAHQPDYPGAYGQTNQGRGIISKIKKIITKKGQPMLFVNLEDQTDKIELVVFPSVIENYPTLFQENKIVLVSGKVDLRDNIPKIICNQIEEILETWTRMYVQERTLHIYKLLWSRAGSIIETASPK